MRRLHVHRHATDRHPGITFHVRCGTVRCAGGRACVRSLLRACHGLLLTHSPGHRNTL